jgi:hypothetical protein
MTPKPQTTDGGKTEDMHDKGRRKEEEGREEQGAR